ncbi:unnamed protein product, partial [Oppiella nova]
MDKLRMCSVCGELAQGYNFCAITCQSCKAFFRRNAYKYEKFKCRFGDICIINEKTRKMCKKCRLKKCFAVGMKKEWILNEEEKLFRRAQIEENRKLKKIKKKTSDESTGSPSSDASNAETIKSGSEEVVNDEEITDYLLQMDNFYTTEPIDTNSNNDNEMSIESIQSATTDSDTSDESMKVVSYINKEFLIVSEGELIDETQSIDCKHRLAVQMHCNALNQINYISCFNSFEIKRLNELTSLCMFQLIPGPKRLKQIMFSSANELMEKAASSFDTSLIKLVERIKSISAFQSLCQNDQISLIKYSCIEVQLLKWGLFYRHENEVYIMDVKYKCKSRNNCQIDGKSRRLCKKCRLKKCFAVGMKKEWILNDEEKESRRRQIEENRIKKFGDQRKITNGSTICTFSSSPGVDPQETDSLLVVSQNEEITDYGEKDKRITLFDDIKYTSSFDDSTIYTISVTTDELMERVATKFDTELQHLVGAIKQLGAFQSLQLNDQIAMIKYNCIELRIMQAEWILNAEEKESRRRQIEENRIKKFGDKRKASYNFCAISCQSCKAFFRRTAFKYETRRFCIKCRLRKCFAVGMKKEWILNEEEKESRRRQIEENRIKKFGDKRKAIMNSMDEPMYTISISPDKFMERSAQTFDVNLQELVITIMNLGAFQSYNFCAISCQSCKAFFRRNAFKYETRRLCKKCRLRKCFAVGMKKEWILNDEEKESRRRQIEENKIKRFGDKRKAIMNSMDEPMYTISISHNKLMESSAQKFDINLQELVTTIMNLGAFQSLSLNDQIAVVKYNCFELELIKAGLGFNHKTGSWIFKGDNNLLCKLELNSFNGFKHNFLAILKYYLNTFAKEFDSDLHILGLLIPVILFNPERPNIIHKDMIELQQQLYLYLLQKYLRYNFCALSCQSCKAFFRRNAFKVNEWILNDEEKEIRKNKIEENRKSKERSTDKKSKPMESMESSMESTEVANMEKNDCLVEVFENNSSNGYNFCAITCESCKAFFRRNASKINDYKCPFDEKCKVDVKTRKFCRRCRLRKCYAVGMKQEWILNDEEKEIRRHKIEENRRCRQISDINKGLATPPGALTHSFNEGNRNFANYSPNNCITEMMDQSNGDDSPIINGNGMSYPTAVKVSVITSVGYKCPFDGKCRMNVVNRKFCKMCEHTSHPRITQTTRTTPAAPPPSPEYNNCPPLSQPITPHIHHQKPSDIRPVMNTSNGMNSWASVPNLHQTNTVPHLHQNHMAKRSASPSHRQSK